MIAGGDDVHSGGEDFLGGPGCDARTAGGIFAVGDDEIELVALTKFRHQRLDRLASRFAHDVADEKNFHPERLTTNHP
jgi:hypothetical protein